jgi:hypothetical protein
VVADDQRLDLRQVERIEPLGSVAGVDRRERGVEPVPPVAGCAPPCVDRAMKRAGEPERLGGAE